MTEKTVTNSKRCSSGRLLDHLQKQGVQLDRVTIQTDNGKEFTTWFDSDKLKRFRASRFGQGREYSPYSLWRENVSERCGSDAPAHRRRTVQQAMPLLTEIEFLVAAKRYLW